MLLGVSGWMGGWGVSGMLSGRARVTALLYTEVSFWGEGHVRQLCCTWRYLLGGKDAKEIAPRSVQDGPAGDGQPAGGQLLGFGQPTVPHRDAQWCVWDLLLLHLTVTFI